VAAGRAAGRELQRRNRSTPSPECTLQQLSKPGRSLDTACVRPEDKNWPDFAQAIKQPDLLADPRFADAEVRHANSGALVTELDRVFGAHPLAHWRLVLDAAHLPCGAVQVWEEIVKDPQLLANQILVPIAERGGGVTMTVDSPVVIKESPKVAPRVAPELGEHTDEVLEELGFDAAQIDELRATGAIPRLTSQRGKRHEQVSI
jgi:crotonobetainyl-CoA:carnitine CoA-transferase CaiB-like acyl-CoA transferase